MLVTSGAMRRGAVGVVGVALALVLTACSDDAADRTEAASTQGSQADPPPEPDVARFRTGVRLDSLTEQLHVVGSTVLAFSATAGDQDPELLRSTDLGESWEPLTLPGASESPTVAYTSVQVGEELAWVTGEDGRSASYPYIAEDVYLWASRDGVEWHGGRLPVTGQPSSLTEPAVGVVGDGTVVAGVVTESGEGDTSVEMFRSEQAGGAWVPAETPDLAVEGGPTFFADIWEGDDGRLVAVLLSDSTEDELTVLVSDDDGQSWRVGSCPEGSAVDTDECQRVSDSGSLEVGPRGVSVAGGEWRTPVLEPPPAEGDPQDFGFEEVIELPGRGWLVATSIFLNQEENFGVLARSDDGVTWQQLFADDPCMEDDLDPEFSQPVRLGTGWLVVHSCLADGTEVGRDLVWADLYVLDGAATEPVLLADTRQEDRRYGQPVAVGDVVLVPVYEEDTADGFTEFVRLTP